MANKQVDTSEVKRSDQKAVLMLQAEVARMMGLSRERVRQLTLMGELPVHEETYGGRSLFRLADVKKLIERREARR